MARTIVLAAPAKQLCTVVGHTHRRWVYDQNQPVWEDQDIQRQAITETRLGTKKIKRAEENPA